jgi:GH24 family phage-related lysozyme (muramidase)
MKTSPQGRQLIEDFEGLFLHAYHDSVGVLTIGYGHTNIGNTPPHVFVGMTITEAQADEALSNDLARFERRVTKIMAPMILPQVQFDALVSFDFNTGDLLSSSIDDSIKAGHNDHAMDTLLQYNHAGGHVLSGLTRRRKAERLMFLGQVGLALQLAKGN